MTIIRYQNQLPTLFDELFNSNFEDWRRANYDDFAETMPAVNIIQSPEQYVVEIAVPGFEKSDFNILLDGDQLTVSSEKKITRSLKKAERFSKREFNYRAFSRSFSLPDSVNASKIAATYENGILAIIIPKKDEVKPRPPKQIKVR